MPAEPKPSPDRRPSADEAKAFTLAPMPPQGFGKYVLIGKLGHGGMAEVNLAVTGGKGGFRKLFVIKRLHAHLETEPGFVDMFLDEARLAAQLDHPHCVQTVEVGEANGQHFLAMEHLDGQGVERLLRMAASHGDLLPAALAARITADALDGLGYAHELVGFDGTPLRVVHRDISPQNLFITYTGVVKVLDFGIAKATSNVVETRTGVVKGKYAYIAPEQALATPIDQRADLWSMGVVFWELLTARRLFKSVNELATLQETLRGDIKKPSEIVPGIPPELDAIAMRALQRDVALRYPTASAFRTDLERFLAKAGAPSDRRAVAALMKERFGSIIDIHRQKLRDCLEAIAKDEDGIERLVAAGIASSEHGALTASGSSPTSSSDGGFYTPSGIGPTPLGARTSENAPAAPAMPRSPGSHAAMPLAPGPRAAMSLSPGSRPAMSLSPGSRPAMPLAPGSRPAISRPPSHAPEARAYAPEPMTAEPADETIRSPPPGSERLRAPSHAQEKTGSRALGWWLVGAGALVVAGVVLVFAFGRDLLPTDTRATETVAVTARVVGGAAVEPTPDLAVAVVEGPSADAAERTPRAPTSESGRSSRGSRRGERGGHASAAETEPVAPGAAEPLAAATGSEASAPAAETATAEATGSDADHGYLALATSPWTTVTWNGTSLGDTPLTRVRLPVGRHSLRLVNAEEGISETYEVEIRPGEVTRARLGLR